ncbi:hypothetical protein N9M53_06470 [Alphaproteobacteria bacterium]|nr:hypothetical protein [Alphaproteobacteria bacterium]
MTAMKMKNIVIISILIMLFPNISLAQTIEPHTEAAKCSGVFFVLTSISEKEPLLGTYFENHKIFSDDLMLLLYLNKTKKQMVKDEVKLLQQFGIKIVEEFYTSSPKYIPQKVSDCIAWNYSIRKTIGTDQIDMSLDSTTIPKYKSFAIYPHDNFEGLIPYVYEAFHIWNSKGKPSPSTLENMLTFDEQESQEEFDPYSCFEIESGEPLPKKCEVSPFERATNHCKDFSYDWAFNPDFDYKNTTPLYFYEKLLLDEINIQFGLEEGTEEYASCVLKVMDYYEPEQGKIFKSNEAINFKQNKKLKEAGLKCSRIGLLWNTIEYGRCVLKLLD